MNGADVQTLWTGQTLEPSRLPHSDGGDRGWLATANTDPFGFVGDGDVTNDDFYYGSFYSPGWRNARINSELERMVGEGPVGLSDMKALQMDTHSNLADDLLPVLGAVWDNGGLDEDSANLRDTPRLEVLARLLLEVWDRKMVRDSSGALVFHAFAHFLTDEIIKDDLPFLYDVIMSVQPVYMLKVAMLVATGAYGEDPIVLENGLELTVLTALDRTADFLEERFGGVDPEGYRFGDIHRIIFDGAFGKGMALDTVPADGGESTVNVTGGTFFDGPDVAEYWDADWVPMERMVGAFSPSGQPRVEVNFPLGNVSDPDGAHFDDMTDDWQSGTYQKLLFERLEIEAASGMPIQLVR
jgi:penicillin amidase